MRRKAPEATEKTSAHGVHAGATHLVDFADPAERPDPRLWQLVFAALVFLDAGLRQFGPSEFAFFSWPTLALIILLAITLPALALPWHHVGLRFATVVAVLDFAVVGMVRMHPEGSAVALFAWAPALWLGAALGRAGIVISVLASTLLVTVPGLVYAEFTLETVPAGNFSRAVFLPLTAGALSWAVAALIDRVRADQNALASASNELGRRERMADAMLDTIDVGVVLLDSRGRYTSTNRSYRQFSELAFPHGHDGHAGQLGEVRLGDGKTLASAEQMPSSRATRGEEFADVLMWVGRDPRTRRAVSTTARSVLDIDGGFAGAALSYKDVTEYIRAQRLGEEFVASVSHELRTPLTSITGYAELLRERADLPLDALEQVGVIVRNADRLHSLVEDLLDVARADNAEPPEAIADCDLSAVVRERIDDARRMVEDAGLALDVEIEDDLVVTGEPKRLAQVVDNLISNAVKYTVDGGVAVALCRDGERVDLTVSDTGIGIPASERGRLFGRFTRADDEAVREQPGVGLGLHIAKQIVDAHGGRVEVVSDVGTGSTFRVRLPVAGAPHERTDEAGEPREESESLQGAPTRIRT